MIEKEIKDRIPTYAGRVKLTPVEGKADHFVFERADEPVEEGTPINKATLDSIIKSRLTGRYYLPTVTKTIISSQTGLTVNPIPISAWVQNSRTLGRAGSWTVETSTTSSTFYPWNALDGNTNTGWESANNTLHTWQISSGSPMALKRFKIQYTGNMTAELQGSDNGVDWKHITLLANPGQLVEYSTANPVSYNYFRVIFTSATESEAGLSEFSILEYDVVTNRNDFVIEAFPTTITDHQRFTIVTPLTVSTTGVITNTLNGRNIDIILQPNKRYELVSSWDGNFYGREL